MDTDPVEMSDLFFIRWLEEDYLIQLRIARILP